MITMVFTTAATTPLSLPPPTKKSQTRQNEEEDSSSSTMVVLIVDVVPPYGKHKATVACWTSSPPLVTASKSDSGNPTLRRNYDDGELGAVSQVAISSIVFRRSPPPSPPLFFVGRSPDATEIADVSSGRFPPETCVVRAVSVFCEGRVVLDISPKIQAKLLTIKVNKYEYACNAHFL
nr:hypothetical protein Iba_chr12dCG21080 [Ipomoea batatas]